jgi:hypothetical protein
MAQDETGVIASDPGDHFRTCIRGSGDCHVASLLAMTRLQVPAKSITYAWGSSRACCMADAYLSVTVNLKTSSSRVCCMTYAYLGVAMNLNLVIARSEATWRSPVASSTRVRSRRLFSNVYSRQRRLPRRFAPRNDKVTGSSKINNLRMGFMERSAATWRSPVASSHSIRSRRPFPNVYSRQREIATS